MSRFFLLRLTDFRNSLILSNSLYAIIGDNFCKKLVKDTFRR
jgi:hypothetical protein